MATFAQSDYSANTCATFRPIYPPTLYKVILLYHKGPKNLAVDLGAGHGLVTRWAASQFKKVTGVDPSKRMMEQAERITNESTSEGHRSLNVEFRQGQSEDLAFIKDGSVDMVVAGQAAHWFDYPKAFKELKRILRPEGTIAFWGYMDHTFVDFPIATEILHNYAYGMNDESLGPYWIHPSREICENRYRDIKPPAKDFMDIQRIEYKAGTAGPASGEGIMFLHRNMKIKDCMEYTRTWSAFYYWQEAHPDRKSKADGGQGDVVDEMYEEMAKTEGWQGDGGWQEMEVEVEWGTGLLLARRRGIRIL
ncbi:MAG: hypothetical protein M1834_007820 [Cirrosporium novae-zelandiae]|nr:MAG: hypothetical protein M1834_007820 [Cirrosporium novae-zelandiae]